MCAEHKDEESIFYAALELKSAEERNSYLKEVCGDDAVLLARIEALLAVYDNKHSILEDAAPFVETVSQGGPITEGPGTVIGNYRLLEQIGEGGMAVVYMAEQEAPIRRKVALKIVKLGMDTKEVIARFEAERQALALMDNPNIAKVLDAGATDTGRPYFVMELVKGIPITAYCDKNNISIQERLNLFLQVCDAVQHAHQKGIIHRDIKPSNVMVTLRDGIPVSKVIDFGIAKAISQRLTEKTFFTQYGQMIGTPAYMSPEQAEFSELDVDTRTDIYSLGVLLYELLIGTTPFDEEKLREAGYLEIQRIICKEDPMKPSTKVSTLGKSLTDIAAHRRTDPYSLTRLIRGDLDWIVMKAMEKDRTLRYASASEFAADINRHLKSEPVQAAAPSISYRLRKYVKRHRVGVMSSLLVVVALMAGLVVSVAMYLQTKQAWKNEATALSNAEQQVKITQAVNEFLHDDLLASADPALSRGRDVTVREVLDAASKKIEERFKDQPLIEAAICETLGRIYRRLGDFKAAELHLQRALQIRQKQLGKQHPETLHSMVNIAVLYENQGKYVEAEHLLSEALVNLRLVEGEEAQITLSCMNNLATVSASLGQHKKAEALFESVLEISRRVLGEENKETLAAMNNLAALYHRSGRYEKAEQLFAETLNTTRKVLGAEHPQTLSAMHNLARVYLDQSRYEQAEQLYVNALDMSRRVLGDQHPDTLGTMNNLAVLFYQQEQYERAEPLFKKVFDTRSRVLGEENPETLQSLNNLAELRSRQKKYSEAESLFARALDAGRRVLGEQHSTTLQSMNGLAAVLCFLGRYEEAEPLLMKALEVGRRVLGEDNCITLQSMNRLASLYSSQKRYKEAEPLFVRTLDIRRRVQGEEHTETLQCMSDLAVLYDSQKRYKEAEPLFVRVLDARRRVLGEEHPKTLESISNLGGFYYSQKRYEDARPLLLKASDGLRRLFGKEHPNTLTAMLNLAQLYTEQQNFKDAEMQYIETLEVAHKALGDDHLLTLMVMHSLGVMYRRQERYDEAEKLLLKVAEACGRVLGAKHPNTANSINTLIELYTAWGKQEEAEKWRKRIPPD